MNARPPPRGHPLKLALARHVAPPRFLAFLVLLPLAGFVHHQLFHPHSWTKSLAIGFDFAAALFLLSLLPLLRERGADAIRARADANEANRIVVLVIASTMTMVVMSAIAGELPAARSGDPIGIVQLVATLLLIWFFANSVYALHYAHDYYSGHPDHGQDCRGLTFPGTDEPGYADFAYFAFTLGMTFQTSDVEISTTRIRGVALLHSFAAFVFNIGVIAFTINALGGA